jgi:hypothetical protein
VSYPQQPPLSPAQAQPAQAQPPVYAPQEPYPGQPPWGQPPYAAPPAHPATQGQPYAAPQAQPQPYAAPQAYAYAAPQPQAAPQGQLGQLAVTACRLCGSVPAAPAKFRGHQGFIVMMRFLSLDGPFCRDCGLATFRTMTSRTLVQGWYGYASFIITPITVLMNLVRRGKVASLPAPQPNPYGPSRPPMEPGPRLLQRPMTIIGLGIPFALIILLVTLISLSS